MAKITITIEDLPDGRVKTVCDPQAKSLAMKCKGSTLTSAESYALFLMNQFVILSDKQKAPSKLKLHLPRHLR